MSPGFHEINFGNLNYKALSAPVIGCLWCFKAPWGREAIVGEKSQTRKGLSQEVVAIHLFYQGLPLIVLQLKKLRNQHKHHVDPQLKVHRHKKGEPGHVH
jgi:hypothetical protein